MEMNVKDNASLVNEFQKEVNFIFNIFVKINLFSKRKNYEKTNKIYFIV